MKSKVTCRDCAHMKHVIGMPDNCGVCSWFDVIQTMDKPIKCPKWIHEPTKDERDMHDITTIPCRNLID